MAARQWLHGDLVMTTGSNQEGDRFTEGFSGFVYLRDAGVPEDAILNIVDGADTYRQLMAAQAQIVERGLDTVLLVSDGYHTRRLRGIADEIGLAAFVAPTDLDASGRDYAREATAVSIGRILHPSPASPAANRDWEGTVERQLADLGIAL